jgi:hypothetical protein
MGRGINVSALARAAAAGAPTCAAIFANVQQSAVPRENVKTNPKPPSSPLNPPTGSSPVTLSATRPCPSRETNPIKPIPRAQQSSSTFRNVHQSPPTPSSAHCETNPPPDLTSRQLAAVRLLLLGRSGRAAARELDLEEHTITRWRRLPAFRAELARQHELALAMLFSRQRLP